MMHLTVDLYEPEELLEGAKFMAMMAELRTRRKEDRRAVEQHGEFQQEDPSLTDAAAKNLADAIDEEAYKAAPSPSAPAADSSSEPETTVTVAAPIEEPAPKKRGRPRKNTEAGGAAPTVPAAEPAADPASVPELTVTDVIRAADAFKNRVGLEASARLLKEKFLPEHKLASFAAVRDRADLWPVFIEFCQTVSA